MNGVYQKIISRTEIKIPDHWKQIHCIDMHTGGEPLRVIVGGYPEIRGIGMLGKRNFAKKHLDHLRKALMWEPRGHGDMYGCLLTEPNDDGAHFGILFIHNEGYSTMCGHAVIAISQLAVEMGWIEKTEPETKVIIDAPCGRIYAYATVKSGHVSKTRFHGVPSFVVALNETVMVDGFGKINYDLAFGGAFYAYVDADALGIDLTIDNYNRIIKAGMDIKREVMKSSDKVKHPFESDLSFLYGTIFISQKASSKADNRNVCIFANGEVDRSPTGSGVSGRMAIHYSKGEIRVDQKMIVESIVGSVFVGSVVEEVDFGPFTAVISEVSGEAYITGQHTFLINPADPFREGFSLR